MSEMFLKFFLKNSKSLTFDTFKKVFEQILNHSNFKSLMQVSKLIRYHTKSGKIIHEISSDFFVSFSSSFIQLFACRKPDKNSFFSCTFQRRFAESSVSIFSQFCYICRHETILLTTTILFSQVINGKSFFEKCNLGLTSLHEPCVT